MMILFFAASLLARDSGFIDRMIEVQELKGTSYEKPMRAALKRAWLATQGRSPGTQHPMSEKECLKKATDFSKFEDRKKCGPRMAFVPGDDGGVCVDMFEFPNRECIYPVVWVSPIEAHDICAAAGK